MKIKYMILILFFVNLLGFIINFPLLFYGSGTFINFMVSIFYLIIWISFFIYAYMKKEFKFSICVLSYWLIALIISIIDLLIIKLNAQVQFAFIKFSTLEYLLSIIFFTPFYGLKSLFNLEIIEYLYLNVLICTTFIILEGIVIKSSIKRPS